MKIVFVLFLVALSPALSQEPGDTTKIYPLPEVVVTATRSLISVKDAPSPVDVIRVAGGNGPAPTSIASLLQTSAGVFVRDNGGHAALKTLFVRGTAPQHLLVLLNGNRLSSFQNGLVDFSLVPIDDIDRIEIVRGGSSALYGADALGGVINILTRQSQDDLRVRVEAGTGSFGYRRYLLEGEGKAGPVSLLTGFGGEAGKDDYPFSIPRAGLRDTSMSRRNSDFVRHNAYLHATLRDGIQELGFSAQGVRSKRGTPYTISYPADMARQNDDEAVLQVNYIGRPGNLEVSLKSGFHYGFETYADPAFSYSTDYKNTAFTINPQIQVIPLHNYRVMAGVEFVQGRLRSKDIIGQVTRIQRSLYLSNEIQLEWERSWGDRLSMYGSLRYDNISDVDDPLMPKIGMNLRLLREGDVRIRGSYGAGFRAPSFNDLYLIGVSNPLLRSERSTSFDAGIMTDLMSGGTQSLEVTYFNLYTKNRILFDLTTFLPVNIGRSRSTGFEMKYQGSFLGRLLSAAANFSRTDARKRDRSSENDPTFNKQLQFIPREMASFSLTANVSQYSLAISHTYVGKRFILQDNSASLPPYGLTSVYATTIFSAGPLRATLKAEVANIFDRDYQIFPGYPMPRRSFQFALGVENL